MAAEVGSAYVTLVPSAKGFASKMQSELGGDLARAGDSTGNTYSDRFSKSAGKGIGARSKSIFGGLAKGGALAAVAAGAAVAKVIGGSIGEARDAQVVTARTENVIKKMGGAANVSAKQVADLAGAISNKTAIDDEAIQAGQNLLLTFGNVRNEAGKGNDIFNQTSQLMVDMSAAMGTDAKGSAIQLGKALNDPIKGITALTRSGVSFTEQQKKQIERLTENGKTMEAQKVILGEVEKQFGGAAAAMATPAEKAKVAWGNFQEEIGTALLPTVDKVLNALSEALPKVLDFGKKVGAVLGPVFATVREAVEKFFGALSGGGGGMGETVSTLRQSFADIQQIVRGAIEVVTTIWKSGWGERFVTVLKAAFDTIRNVVAGALRVVKGIINVVMGVLKGDWGRAWKGIKQILSGVWQALKAVVSNGITVIKTLLGGMFSILRGIFSRGWDLIKTLAVAGVGKLVDAVKAIPGKLRDLGGLFASAGKAIIDKFIDGLAGAAGLVSDIAGNVWDSVRGLLNDAIAKINAALEFTVNPPGPGTITINPPDIPALATGGRVAGATLALIGEGKEPETVLPDSMLRGLLERTAAAARGGQVGLLTITNWRDGTGYFRLLADEAVADEAGFRRDLGAMHA